MLLEMTRPVQGGLRQERKLEAVSNNLANANTTGYKKDRISFDAKFKAQINKDFAQGNIRDTGNPLDFALSGQGFFKVETPEGIRYTRDGNFTIDANGNLVTQNGYPVMGQGGIIAVNAQNPDQDLYVNQAGDILVNGQVVDTLDVVTFQDLRKMERYGKNLLSYKGETTDEVPVNGLIVQQRSLEESNTGVVEEMARMIDDHRMFESFSKVIINFDEVDNKAINDVGQLR